MNRFVLLPCVLLAAGCATMKDPSGAIVDMQGVNPQQYEIDLAECRQYADEVPVAKHVGTAAAAGAVTGAVGGVLSGANTSGIGQTAGVGAVYGGAAAGVSAVREHRYVLRECLRGRGYRVLN